MANMPTGIEHHGNIRLHAELCIARQFDYRHSGNGGRYHFTYHTDYIDKFDQRAQ